MKRLIFLIITFVIPSTYSFDWDRCSNDKYNKGFLGLPISTSQYLTSTGDCAMIGFSDHDKKIFIAHNKDQLKNDIARGEGEYLEAYLKLSNYSDAPFIADKLKSNFSYIFGKNGEASAQQAYERIENILKKDNELRKYSVPRV